MPDGRFAIEKYEISYLVSGRELVSRSSTRKARFPDCFDAELRLAAGRSAEDRGRGPQRRQASGGAIEDNAAEAAVAPLGHARRCAGQAGAGRYAEAGTVHREVAGGARGGCALETLVKAANGPRVLLLATHGFFNPPAKAERGQHADRGNGRGRRTEIRRDARQSFVALRRFAGRLQLAVAAGGDDGILTGMEILDIDLRGTELVVLSACDTGVGDLRTGEGVAGIRQAFQLAGGSGGVDPVAGAD